MRVGRYARIFNNLLLATYLGGKPAGFLFCLISNVYNGVGVYLGVGAGVVYIQVDLYLLVGCISLR